MEVVALVEVLARVDSLQDVAHAALVSRVWAEAARQDSVWRRLLERWYVFPPASPARGLPFDAASARDMVRDAAAFQAAVLEGHWSDRKLTPVVTISGAHASGVRCLARVGRVAITGAREGDIRVWDLSKGTLVGEVNGAHSMPVNAVALSDDARVAVSGSRDTTLRVWSLEADEEDCHKGDGCCDNGDNDNDKDKGKDKGKDKDNTTGTDAAASCGDRVPDASLTSPDAPFPVAGITHVGLLHDPEGGHTGSIASIKVHTREVNGVTQRIVLSGGHDSKFCVWDLDTRKLLERHDDHEKEVAALDVRGRRAVTGSMDSNVRVWDVSGADGKGAVLKHTLKGHFDAVLAVRIAGARVISGGRDTELRIWNVKKGKTLVVLKGHEAAISGIDVTRKFIVSSAHDKTVRVWDGSKARLLQTLLGHPDWVNAVSIATNAIVSCSADRTIRIWRPQEEKTGAGTEETEEKKTTE